jgi:predicted phage terminase large subunit-like protein
MPEVQSLKSEAPGFNPVAVAIAKELELKRGFSPPRPARHRLKRKPVLIIHLREYVRRLFLLRGIDIDPWQENFCDRLEAAFFGQDEKAMQAAIAVMPQAGKSVIISQAYIAWILGHDHYHRVVLACYNLKRSRKHAQALIAIMRSPFHRQIFTDPNGWIPNIVSDKEFSTIARLDNYDGQDSFTAASLLTGLTGIGYDTLIIDDPYKDRNEANSETIREKSWNFLVETAQMRGGDTGNIFLMFHRYHQDDIGGRALASDFFTFEYWHYDAEFVGDYVDDETGRSYPDAFPRELGEYLSPRRSDAFYERQKKNPVLWNSQFQQRPTGAGGNMFDVRRIREVDQLPDESEFAFVGRGWDNATTKDGGDFTVGIKMGIRHDESIHIFDDIREQLDSGARLELQKDTAEDDGKMVLITHPVDPAAGKDTAFQFQQMLPEYTVELMPTTERKEVRAHPFSVAVNRGLLTVPKGALWYRAFKNEVKHFPGSTHKDQVDAAGDVYRKLHEKLKHGLVIKTFAPQRNVVGWSAFAKRFGKGVPHHWHISAGLKVSNDSSVPSGAVLVARAAENAFIGEAVFVLACYKQLSGDFASVVNWLKKATDFFVQKEQLPGGKLKPKPIPLLWMSDKSSDEIQTACSKLKVKLGMFEGELETGIPETNWYFSEEPKQKHPFYPNMNASRAYLLAADKQVDNPINELGLISLRQELAAWTYNQKTEPQEHGGVITECLKMILTGFKPQALKLTAYEKVHHSIDEEFPHLSDAAIDKEKDVQVRQQRRLQRQIKMDKMLGDQEKPDVQDDGTDLMEFLKRQGQIK